MQNPRMAHHIKLYSILQLNERQMKAPDIKRCRGLSFGQSPVGPVWSVGLAVRGIALVIGGVLPGQMFRGVVSVGVVPG